MSANPNQREFLRVHVPLGVRVEADGRSVPAEGAQELSMKGVYIRSAAPPALGSACHVELRVDSGPVVIEVEGEVVRIFEEGFAVQFTRILGLESFEHLKRLVTLNADNPEDAEREIQAHAGIRKRG